MGNSHRHGSRSPETTSTQTSSCTASCSLSTVVQTARRLFRYSPPCHSLPLASTRHCTRLQSAAARYVLAVQLNSRELGAEVHPEQAVARIFVVRHGSG